MIKRMTGLVLAGVMAMGAASLPSQSPRTLSSSSSPLVPQSQKPSTPVIGTPPSVRLPGFAAWLADQLIMAGSSAWGAIPDAAAWRAIAGATSDQRQVARWAYARSLIATARGPDAIGVLEVMITDDPDLALVAAWQRARGVAQVQARHLVDGLAALRQPGLAGDPEFCLWRMRALADHGEATAAFAEFNCALPALNARDAVARRPFILAAARAATETGGIMSRSLGSRRFRMRIVPPICCAARQIWRWVTPRMRGCGSPVSILPVVRKNARMLR